VGICRLSGNIYQNTRQGVKQSWGVVGGSEVRAAVPVKRGIIGYTMEELVMIQSQLESQWVSFDQPEMGICGGGNWENEIMYQGPCKGAGAGYG
jgi:hypothetical protein